MNLELAECPSVSMAECICTIIRGMDLVEARHGTVLAAEEVVFDVFDLGFALRHERDTVCLRKGKHHGGLNLHELTQIMKSRIDLIQGIRDDDDDDDDTGLAAMTSILIVQMLCC